MGIQWDHPAALIKAEPDLRIMKGGSGSMPNRQGLGSDSFSRLLTRISDRRQVGEEGCEQLAESAALQKSRDIESALALVRRITIEMNESLLRLLSDEKEAAESAATALDDLDGIVSKEIPPYRPASTIQQGLSGNPTIPNGSEIYQGEGTSALDLKADIPPEGGSDIHDIVQKASRAFEVDSDLILRVIEAESGFNPDAVSPKGAMGLMQLMPETAKELGVADPMDPSENIMGGTRYLKKLLDRYEGSVPLALAAYNWGMGNLDRHRERMPLETRNYIARITGSEVNYL